MKKYTLKYIVSLIFIVLYAIVVCAVWVSFDQSGQTIPFGLMAIFATTLAGATHVIAGCIYDAHRDEVYEYHKFGTSNIGISKNVIALIFIISIGSQIVCTLLLCIEAWKRFGTIHFTEYILAGVLLFISAYLFRKSSYKLINKEKKDE